LGKKKTRAGCGDTYPAEKFEFGDIWKVLKFHGSSHHQPDGEIHGIFDLGMNPPVLHKLTIASKLLHIGSPKSPKRLPLRRA
jgi:hypothetical protein